MIDNLTEKKEEELISMSMEEFKEEILEFSKKELPARFLLPLKNKLIVAFNEENIKKISENSKTFFTNKAPFLEVDSALDLIKFKEIELGSAEEFYMDNIIDQMIEKSLIESIEFRHKLKLINNAEKGIFLIRPKERQEFLKKDKENRLNKFKENGKENHPLLALLKLPSDAQMKFIKLINESPYLVTNSASEEEEKEFKSALIKILSFFPYETNEKNRLIIDSINTAKAGLSAFELQEKLSKKLALLDSPLIVSENKIKNLIKSIESSNFKELQTSVICLIKKLYTEEALKNIDVLRQKYEIVDRAHQIFENSESLNQKTKEIEKILGEFSSEKEDLKILNRESSEYLDLEIIKNEEITIKETHKGNTSKINNEVTQPTISSKKEINFFKSPLIWIRSKFGNRSGSTPTLGNHFALRKVEPPLKEKNKEVTAALERLKGSKEINFFKSPLIWIRSKFGNRSGSTPTLSNHFALRKVEPPLKEKNKEVTAALEKLKGSIIPKPFQPKNHTTVCNRVYSSSTDNGTKRSSFAMK